MRTPIRTLVVTLGWLAGLTLGCGAAGRGDVDGSALAVEPDSDPTVRIATDPVPAADPLPPHRFTAASHPAHDRPTRVVAPDPARVPKLTLRLGQCYGEPREQQLAGGTRGGGGLGTGYGRGGGGAYPAPPAKPQAKSAPALPAAAAAPSGGALGASGGDLGNATAGPPPAPKAPA